MIPSAIHVPFMCRSSPSPCSSAPSKSTKKHWFSGGSWWIYHFGVPFGVLRNTQILTQPIFYDHCCPRRWGGRHIGPEILLIAEPGTRPRFFSAPLWISVFLGWSEDIPKTDHSWWIMVDMTMIIDGHYPLNKKLTSSLLSQLRNGLLVNGHINCLAVQLTAIKGLLGLTVGFGRYGLLKNKGFPNGNFNGEDDILISCFQTTHHGWYQCSVLLGT